MINKYQTAIRWNHGNLFTFNMSSHHCFGSMYKIKQNKMKKINEYANIILWPYQCIRSGKVQMTHLPQYHRAMYPFLFQQCLIHHAHWMAVVFVVAKGRISLLIHKKANLSDLIAATSLVILQNWIQMKAISEYKLELQSGNARIWNLTDDLEKEIGHLFYATSSFVHRFEVIGEFKLDIQTGNAEFGSKSTIFVSRVTLKFDGWPWTSIGHIS